MNKAKLAAYGRRLCLIPILLATILAVEGCTGLTGGSVPTGNGGTRPVTGRVILPGGHPASSAAVSVFLLPSSLAVLSGVADSSGQFTVSDVPTNADILISAIPQASTGALKVVIPQATLAASAQTLDVGDITALTTVVAHAIELETNQNPLQSSQIVATQMGPLAADVNQQNQSTSDQQQEIDDQGFLDSQAKATIVNTANIEIAALADHLDVNLANTALLGALAYIQVAQERPLQISDPQRSILVAQQVAGKSLTADALAAALRASGITDATSIGVSTDSAVQRGVLPALSSLGPGISPFEGLLIAASQRGQGGFQADQAEIDSFLAYITQ